MSSLWLFYSTQKCRQTNVQTVLIYRVRHVAVYKTVLQIFERKSSFVQNCSFRFLQSAQGVSRTVLEINRVVLIMSLLQERGWHVEDHERRQVVENLAGVAKPIGRPFRV